MVGGSWDMVVSVNLTPCRLTRRLTSTGPSPAHRIQQSGSVTKEKAVPGMPGTRISKRLQNNPADLGNDTQVIATGPSEATAGRSPAGVNEARRATRSVTKQGLKTVQEQVLEGSGTRRSAKK